MTKLFSMQPGMITFPSTSFLRFSNLYMLSTLGMKSKTGIWQNKIRANIVPVNYCGKDMTAYASLGLVLMWYHTRASYARGSLFI